ncbi:DM13 domain-containing protein [Leptolyngbya sp. 7M]|uniref:DM13 domain-containing protein n=1 Tax=Leptolyngbya sp. 7M TaxID=2812896 RepID=UPI001CEE056A|nr:DM13 domain-containing protein [Leptolyngbya sp. 7M]
MKRNLFGMLAITAFLMVSCAEPRSTNVESPAVESPAPSVGDVGQASPATELTTKSGTFVAGEHPTTGTVRVGAENGQQFIELGEDFKTSEMGPDLVVILHQDADVLGSTQPPAYALTADSYVVIAPLQQFQGAQRYEIPANVNLSDYASAAIWCRRFNATFGAATLR